MFADCLEQLTDKTIRRPICHANLASRPADACHLMHGSRLVRREHAERRDNDVEGSIREGPGFGISRFEVDGQSFCSGPRSAIVQQGRHVVRRCDIAPAPGSCKRGVAVSGRHHFINFGDRVNFCCLGKCFLGANDVKRQFEIRPASSSDAAALSTFAAEQFRATYSGDTPTSDLEAYISNSFTQAKQLEEIEGPGSDILLAVNGSDIIGFAHVRFKAAESPVAFLNRIYVNQTSKGNGVGSSLLAKIIDIVQGSGGDRLRLTVYEKNIRAIAFYIKADFEVVGTELFTVGEDRQIDLVMERRLV